MNFCKKTEGAISVFLVIILVPCLFITSLFVDVGRVYLSQSMAYSSADLALNTVLTKYDKDLNEWFGLVASCQDMDEFYDVSEEYFKRTISSQNLEESEIVLLEQMYQNMIRQIQNADADEIHDLLRVDVVDEVTISPYENANLTNETLLKEQIVEFMKYRGPITVTSEVLDMIMDSDENLKPEFEILKDADSDEEIVEAKKEFHESEAEFLGKAYRTYSYLYQNYSEDLVQNDDLKGKIQQLEDVRTTYYALHSKMVHDLYNTSDLAVFNRPRVALNKYDSTYNVFNTASYVGTSEDDEETAIYYITATDLSMRKAALEQAIAAFQTSINTFATQVGVVPYNSSTYDIQYWYQTQKIYEGQGYRYDIALKAENMMNYYSYLKASLTCTADIVDVPSSQLLAECVSTLSSVQTLQSKYLADTVRANGDPYLTIALNLERISADEIWKISQDCNVTINDTTATFNTHLSSSASTLSEIRSFCQKYVDVLDIVINGNGKDEDESDCIVSLDRLLELVQAYETSLDNYKDTTEVAADSSMKDLAVYEIAQLTGEEYAVVSEESVAEMKTRLSNIRKQYQDVIDAIDGMTYGGKKLIEITTYNTFKSCASGVVSNDTIGLTKSEIQTNTNNTFNSLFVPTTSQKSKLVEFNESDDYNLLIWPEDNVVNVPQLYMYMYNTFGPPDDEKVKEVEDEMSDAKDLAKQDNEEEVTGKLYNVNAEEIPSAVSGGSYAGFSGLTDTIASLSGIVNDIATLRFDRMRDDLYIAVYIMEMFSCATHENEGLYERYKEKGSGEITALTGSNVKSAYTSVKTDAREMWLSTSTLDAYNKSLTNKLINQDNNPGYRCEIEYILYGKGTNKENIQAAYTDIFAIRTTLNTISGFVNFWGTNTNTGAAIDGVATVVSKASSGVVPPSAIKLVLILVIIALETCNDMERLAYGFPVELYKEEERNWQYSLSSGSSAGGITSLTQEMSSKGTELPRNTDDGLFYSDYITLFVCIAVTSDDKCIGVMKRIADVIQFNMQDVTDNSAYKLSNANTHFKLDTKLKVDPIITDLALFSDYNSELESSTSWLEYEINAVRGY